MKDNLQAPWIGYGPDYWENEEDEVEDEDNGD